MQETGLILQKLILHLAIVRLFLGMRLADPKGINAADGAVKGLGFLGRMGRDIELLRAMLPCPGGALQEERPAQTFAPIAVIGMQL